MTEEQPVSNSAAPSVDQLFPELYAELRRIAHGRRRRHGQHETLSTTALVNEAYLRLKRAGRLAAKDRLHFLALSARAMRFVLIDSARRTAAERPGAGGQPPAGTEVEPAGANTEPETMLTLDRALARLSELHPRMAKVVEYRFFGGMTEAEIAEVLSVSKRTVRDDWHRAKLWLLRDLAELSTSGPPGDRGR